MRVSHSTTSTWGPRLNAADVKVASFNDPCTRSTTPSVWTHGRHAFRFVGDYRAPRTSGFSFQLTQVAFFGNLGGAATAEPPRPRKRGYGTPSLGATTVTPGPGRPTLLCGLHGNKYQAFNFRQNLENHRRKPRLFADGFIGGLNTPYWISSAKRRESRHRGLAGHHNSVEPLSELGFERLRVLRQDESKSRPEA
jgi:hypothetical protein